MGGIAARAGTGVTLALLLSPCSVASGSSSSRPSKEELRGKSVKELKAILKKKGTKCKKCIEKDDFVQKVYETWDLGPKQAASPDGKLQLTKEAFIQNLKHSYAQQTKGSASSDQDGHELESEDGSLGGEGLTDEHLEQIWREFSEKLELGQVEKDDNGQLLYQIPNMGPSASLWAKYKMPIMMAGNLALLWCSQRVRRRSRKLEREQAEEEAAAKSDEKDKSE